MSSETEISAKLASYRARIREVEFEDWIHSEAYAEETALTAYLNREFGPYLGPVMPGKAEVSRWQ